MNLRDLLDREQDFWTWAKGREDENTVELAKEFLKMGAADEFTIRVLPQSPAGRFALLQELYEGPPIFCDCGCDCVVGHGPSMIDRETFLRLVSTSAKEGGG